MRLVLAALLTVSAIPVLAQDIPTEAPGAPDPSRVVAGTYNVDSDHTQVLFTVTHLGFSTYTGMFVAPTGTLTIDPKNPSAAKVDLTFPIAKVVPTATGLDEPLQNADFFDAAKYQTGRSVSHRVPIANQPTPLTGNPPPTGYTRP